MTARERGALLSGTSIILGLLVLGLNAQAALAAGDRGLNGAHLLGWLLLLAGFAGLAVLATRRT